MDADIERAFEDALEKLDDKSVRKLFFNEDIYLQSALDDDPIVFTSPEGDQIAVGIRKELWCFIKYDEKLLAPLWFLILNQVAISCNDQDRFEELRDFYVQTFHETTTSFDKFEKVIYFLTKTELLEHGF